MVTNSQKPKLSGVFCLACKILNYSLISPSWRCSFVPALRKEYPPKQRWHQIQIVFEHFCENPPAVTRYWRKTNQFFHCWCPVSSILYIMKPCFMSDWLYCQRWRQIWKLSPSAVNFLKFAAVAVAAIQSSGFFTTSVTQPVLTRVNIVPFLFGLKLEWNRS